MNPLLVFLLCAGLLNETDPQRNGKVFEETTYEDRMGLLEQLGVKLS